MNFHEKKKKPPTEVDDLNQCNDIITDYLKFVKPPTAAAEEVLRNINNQELLSAILEYIAMRAEIKDKMSSRSVKMFVKKLDDICDLQGITQTDRLSVKLEMISKAVSGGWKSVFPLNQSELDFIKRSYKKPSFDLDRLKCKINNFD